VKGKQELGKTEHKVGKGAVTGRRGKRRKICEGADSRGRKMWGRLGVGERVVTEEKGGGVKQ